MDGGLLTVPESGLLGYVLGPELDPGTGPMAVGHQVWTMGVAMAVGLGLVLWRTRRPWWRVLAWVLPAAVLALAMVDHAGYNAAVQWLDWAEEGSGMPGWIGWLWLRTGRGHAQVTLSVVLLVVCLLVDA
ncbi:hypothetical protein [Actinomyces sp. 2119]|uniref:hypothetical protein n=1 Tax=Actinomyces sp. 2119 TaxID=2321393 RepID=UPI0016002D4A|nr:hypothetical protein [Actinomyces sp. 2119]